MKPPTVKERILKALEAGPNTSRNLAKELSISLGTVPACMSQLHLEGRVEVDSMTRYGASRARTIIWRKLEKRGE